MKFFVFSSFVLLTLVNNARAVWEDLINDSLTDYKTFETYWEYLYPWGQDHNGSARMYGASDDHNHVYLEDNTIVLKASRINWDEGKSTADPYPVIHYHSGAIHSKQTFTINDQFPDYEFKGEFIAPTKGGTWPAFWLNGAWSWPPEIDILEFKGNNVNWFNTFRTSSDVSTRKDTVSNPNTWHEYRVWITKVSNTDMDIHFYIDGEWKAKHTANHVGKPFHLIMNLQMEGSSGGNGPSGDTYYKGRNIYVGRSNNNCTGDCAKKAAATTTVAPAKTETKAPVQTQPQNSNNNNSSNDDQWEVLIDDSLKDYKTFESYWNYLYPWGQDHNGSARMYGASDDHNHIYLEDNTIVLKASRINWDEGKSTSDPYPVIHYHSGAIHAKQTFTINDQYPDYEFKGEFIAPTKGGTWPAFWLTGVNSWPPEVDILEFKGNNVNWFNTFRTSSDVSTRKDTISNPNTWHEYRVWITKVSNTNVDIHFYIDGVWKAKHTANHVGKAFYLIMNLQMEGSSGGNGPSGDTYYKGRKIFVGRTNTKCTTCGKKATTTTAAPAKTETKAPAQTQDSKNDCFSYPTYPCCVGNTVYYVDEEGSWGVENGNWCGIKSNASNAANPSTSCWSKELGYNCCTHCSVVYTDESGKWGVENNNWCGITC